MSDLLKIVLTSSLTVLGGILVFVIGQIVIKFVLEPLHEQSQLIGEIAGSVIFYANVGASIEEYYFQQLQQLAQSTESTDQLKADRLEALVRNNWRRSDEAAEVLRRQASQLMGTANAIPFYGLWSRLPFSRVPKFDNVILASQELIGMSNTTHRGDSRNERIRKIAELLEIKTVSRRIGVE